MIDCNWRYQNRLMVFNRYKYSYLYICLSAERDYSQWHTSSVSKPSTLILVSVFHCPRKESRAPWRKWLIPGPGKVQDEPGISDCTKKNGLKLCWVHEISGTSDTHREHSGASMVKCGTINNIKINKMIVMDLICYLRIHESICYK